MFTCEECETEFEVYHDSANEPEFCPFCGSKLTYDDEDLDEDFWDEDEED